MNSVRIKMIKNTIIESRTDRPAPTSQNLIPNKNSKSPSHSHRTSDVPPPSPSCPLCSRRLRLWVRNSTLLVPLQQLLAIRHRRRPNRINNRRGSRSDELQPEQRRPSEACYEEFETLGWAGYGGLGPKIWDGGRAESTGEVER